MLLAGYGACVDYLWGSSVEGSQSLFGLPAVDVDLRFGDILDKLDFAASGLFEVQGERFGFLSEGTMNQIQLRDIGIKTHRGQKGRVKDGKLAGGNAYGYDVLPAVTVNGKSEHGDRAINRTEAEVVRRIFRDYAQGLSAGKIAEALNNERIPAPAAAGGAVPASSATATAAPVS